MRACTPPGERANRPPIAGEETWSLWISFGSPCCTGRPNFGVLRSMTMMMVDGRWRQALDVVRSFHQLTYVGWFQISGGSRWTATPRKQIPLDESESLDVAEEAFNLKSSFRDGQVLLDFGTPGPPSGKSPTLYLQVSYELPLVLAGEAKGRDLCSRWKVLSTT